MLPAFISAWDAKALKARVGFGVQEQEALTPPASALERRYAPRAAKVSDLTNGVSSRHGSVGTLQAAPG